MARYPFDENCLLPRQSDLDTTPLSFTDGCIYLNTGSSGGGELRHYTGLAFQATGARGENANAASGSATMFASSNYYHSPTKFANRQVDPVSLQTGAWPSSGGKAVPADAPVGLLYEVVTQDRKLWARLSDKLSALRTTGGAVLRTNFLDRLRRGFGGAPKNGHIEILSERGQGRDLRKFFRSSSLLLSEMATNLLGKFNEEREDRGAGREQILKALKGVRADEFRLSSPRGIAVGGGSSATGTSASSSATAATSTTAFGGSYLGGKWAIQKRASESTHFSKKFLCLPN